MKNAKRTLALSLICVGTAACTPSWFPFGHDTERQNALALSTQAYNGALAALDRQDYEMALLRFQSLNRSFRESSTVINGIALAYAGMGEFARAEYMFKAALDADPHNGVAIGGLDRIYRAQMGNAIAVRPVEELDNGEIVLSAPGSLSTPELETADIVVTNGNGTVGLASRVASELERREFAVKSVRSADRFDYERSVIEYGAGQKVQARRLAQALGVDAQLIEKPQTGDEIVVILGADAN